VAQPLVKKIPQNPLNSDFIASGSNTSIAKTQKEKLFTLLEYNVYLNDEIIAEQIEETYYLDEDLNGWSFIYDVKAVYEEGISEGAGPIQVFCWSPSEREYVIIETGIGTWSQNAPGVSMGLDDLRDSVGFVVVCVLPAKECMISREVT